MELYKAKKDIISSKGAVMIMNSPIYYAIISNYYDVTAR